MARQPDQRLRPPSAALLSLGRAPTFYQRLGSHPEVRACAGVNPVAARLKETWRIELGARVDNLNPIQLDEVSGAAITQAAGTRALWSCASDKIAEAEKLLGK